jgi:hypothetical protein
MSKAIARYLEESAEPEAALADRVPGAFGHAVEIPAYGEGESLFRTLASVPAGSRGDVLIVVVLNARGDSPREVHEANAVARERIAALGPADVVSGHPEARLFPAVRGRVLLIDRAAPSSYLPPGQGVGLARKIGCDFLLRLHAGGRLTSPWIHATDADVSLPPDYFDQVAGLDPESTAAAHYFFEHRFPADEALATAGRLYEIRLRYNTLGLAWAGSPYAYETLGSCLAVSARAYAEVGGFPKKNALEDVTILNALARIGAVERLAGAPIGLEGRISTRVPISTGKALSDIVRRPGAEASFLLPHPLAFAHLAAWIRVLDALARRGADALVAMLPRGNPFFRADLLEEALAGMGAFAAVREAIRVPGEAQEILHRLHGWFDAFRTRQLVDALGTGGLTPLPYRQALTEAPFTGLADSTEDDLETLRAALVEEERALGVHPAGVPPLVPEGA